LFGFLFHPPHFLNGRYQTTGVIALADPLGQIVTPTRDDVSNAPTRVGNVPRISGNDMHVQVTHRLPCGSSTFITILKPSGVYRSRIVFLADSIKSLSADRSSGGASN
jgi:hypothetical protein